MCVATHYLVHGINELRSLMTLYIHIMYNPLNVISPVIAQSEPKHVEESPM